MQKTREAIPQPDGFHLPALFFQGFHPLHDRAVGPLRHLPLFLFRRPLAGEQPDNCPSNVAAAPVIRAALSCERMELLLFAEPTAIACFRPLPGGDIGKFNFVRQPLTAKCASLARHLHGEIMA